MRTLSSSLLILLLVVLSTGCDSSNDGNDADVFVGAWVLQNVLLNGQDLTPLLLAQADVDIDFATSSFTLTATDGDGMQTQVAGTYQLNESQKTITLTSPDLAQPVTLSYDIANDNRITLETADPTLLVELSGLDPSDFGIDVERVELVLRRSS